MPKNKGRSQEKVMVLDPVTGKQIPILRSYTTTPAFRKSGMIVTTSVKPAETQLPEVAENTEDETTETSEAPKAPAKAKTKKS